MRACLLNLLACVCACLRACLSACLLETDVKAFLLSLAKKFCFLDADCVVVGESQGSSTGDRHQAWRFYLAKQCCFLDADCLVLGESQVSSRRSVGKNPVKPPRPEGDSKNIDSFFFNNRYFNVSSV